MAAIERFDSNRIEYRQFIICIEPFGGNSKSVYWEVGGESMPGDGRIDFGIADSRADAIKKGKQSADDYRMILGL